MHAGTLYNLFSAMQTYEIFNIGWLEGYGGKAAVAWCAIINLSASSVQPT